VNTGATVNVATPVCKLVPDIAVLPDTPSVPATATPPLLLIVTTIFGTPATDEVRKYMLPVS
jgi:hypothetical protein